MINIFLSLAFVSCLAYIGPGLGGGAIAAVFGFIAAFILGLWGILYYPIKRAIKNRKSLKKVDNNFKQSEQ